ncbi:MAG TPA: NUDIX domain-containing protein [Patescibacteria group bacterium]|nr:NUDIX domain-containing protein [Patescibacteria group bacterium]
MKHEISAGGIVFKKAKGKKPKAESNLWLICQHSQHKGWVFPKGLVGDDEKDELLEEAALRETKEEGGVEARIVKKLPGVVEYFYVFQGKRIKKTVHYFLMEYVRGDPKDHDWEMSEAKFVSEKKVGRTLTYSTDRETFAEAIALKRKLS